MKTILTGIKNTGIPHLGNYLGMYLSMADLQSKYVKSGGYKMNAFIPDLHSLNEDRDYSSLDSQTIFNLKCYIASGLDPSDSNTIFYRQSRISAHSELAILLHNFAYMGELSRQTNFKEKSAGNNESVSVGLFYYPILMAADILLYDAEFVPVGDDQRQHVELARDLAIRINNKFKDNIFTVPASMKDQANFAGLDEAPRIMSLSDPTKKMSKSVSDPKGTIDLTDSPESARKKIMSATTDSIGKINYDPINQAGISNLIDIYSLLNKEPIESILARYSNLSYGEFKMVVADSIGEFLSNFKAKLDLVTDDHINIILSRGEETARKISQKKLADFQRVLGFKLD
jgi:tryptophanyl-tRNA synthetase